MEILILPVCICDVHVALRATACENEPLTVSCSGEDVIQVINAHYGRLENDICESNIGTPDTECLFSGTRDVVKNRSVIHGTSSHTDNRM